MVSKQLLELLYKEYEDHKFVIRSQQDMTLSEIRRQNSDKINDVFDSVCSEIGYQILNRITNKGQNHSGNEVVIFTKSQWNELMNSIKEVDHE